MSAPVAAAAPAGHSAEELLRITLGAINARPRFRLGHVEHGKMYAAGTEEIRDSYQLATAIEAWLARNAGGEDA